MAKFEMSATHVSLLNQAVSLRDEDALNATLLDGSVFGLFLFEQHYNIEFS
jgi:hypothetical protein